MSVSVMDSAGNDNRQKIEFNAEADISVTIFA